MWISAEHTYKGILEDIEASENPAKQASFPIKTLFSDINVKKKHSSENMTNFHFFYNHLSLTGFHFPQTKA